MSFKTENIIIVGGGSAGWMSASTLISLFPEKNITVIENPNIPTVGVGESTLGYIRGWMHTIGLKEEDFMKDTDASYKMSIRFTNFYEKNSGSFHYPFGKINFSEGAQLGLNDWYVKKYYRAETGVDDFVRSFYPQMPLVENNRFDENQSNIFGSFNPKTDVAYHFDAVKFANWLREKFAIPKGVKHILGNVDDVIQENGCIKYLVLDTGEKIDGDLYIDCTGFKSLLLDKSLKEPFISYSDLLPNNRAWATKIKYKNKDTEMQPFTDCTAIGNGWVWNIPSWSRIGTGYVYSDKFISKEDALEEFKDYLKASKGVEDVNDLEFKDIEMRIGIHERIWVNNVAAIGLSAGFIEPLESNGLLTVHEFILRLCKFIDKEVVTRFDQDVYNRGVTQYFDNFANFVASHYALSKRNDTEYWEYNSNKCFKEEVYKRIASCSRGLSDLADAKMFHRKFDDNDGVGYACISTGMNFFPVDKMVIKEWEHHDGVDSYMDEISTVVESWKNNYDERTKKALKCPTIHQYLKNKIHKSSGGFK